MSATMRPAAFTSPPTRADSGVGQTLISDQAAPSPAATSPAVPVAAGLSLTIAEQNVMRRLIAGLSAHQIAAERGTSVKTVEAQIYTVKLKAGVRTSYELGAWAQRQRVRA